jgi:hypothetical protein
VTLLPNPPVQSAINSSTQTSVTAVMAAFALGAFAFSLFHWRRTRNPMFLLLFVSGGCMMLMEPAVDTVGGCWFPKIHSWVVFTAWGRPIPVWLCLAYFFYFGILGGVFWTIMRRGVTRAQVFGLFAIGMAGDFILETVLLHFNTYIYYGGQPLRVLKFPLWWAPVNSVIVVVLAAVIVRFEQALAGRRQLLVVPLSVSVSAALNCAAGWPSWFVINTPMGPVPRQIGGLATFALAFWFVSLVPRLLPEPAAHPVRSDARSSQLPLAV